MNEQTKQAEQAEQDNRRLQYFDDNIQRLLDNFKYVDYEVLANMLGALDKWRESKEFYLIQILNRVNYL